MDLAVAGAAVMAIRTGSVNLEALVVHLNYLYEESLFVSGLERLCREAHRRLIPATGQPLPEKPAASRFENVSLLMTHPVLRPPPHDASLEPTALSRLARTETFEICRAHPQIPSERMYNFEHVGELLLGVLPVGLKKLFDLLAQLVP
ncbi:hypothetical protein [Streptomyces sp. NPDC051636]|uniref:hypothetical protein n=1 Tax=Streptomyces sp. NPDC051636 TaxID=3365663 RepID=UPI003789F28C